MTDAIELEFLIYFLHARLKANSPPSHFATDAAAAGDYYRDGARYLAIEL